MAWDGPRTASSKITSTYPWQKLRREVLARDGYECQQRGPNCTGYADQVDHDHSVATGGADLDPANARAICEPCHRDKTRSESNRGQTAWKRKPEPHPALRNP